MTDHRAVVERPGERVAPGRLHQLRGLPRQATLGRPEDQEEQRRGDQRGGQRDEHDVATNERQAIEDRHRVAPDRDDAEHLAIDADRQVLAQEGRRAENAGTGSRCFRGQDLRPGCPADGQREFTLDGDARAADRRVVRGHDRAVRPAELDPQDLVRARQGRQLSFELGGSRARIGDRGGGREIRGLDVGVDEGPRRRRIAADDVVQRRRLEVRPDHVRLRRGRDPDERDERAEYEDEQRRSRQLGMRAEHAGLR